MIVRSTFRPAWWLSNPHAQTVWTPLRRTPPRVALTRERMTLDDGDFLDLDHAPERPGPVVLVLHGLEGNPESVYARAVLAALTHAGYRAVRLYHRSCSGVLNVTPQLYHSGFTDDAVSVLNLLARRYPGRPLAVVGYSLGGSVVLNLLGRPGAAAALERWPAAAVAISVPLDLAACARRIDSGWSRVYQRRLLGSMQAKVAAKHARGTLAGAPAGVDVSRALAARNFFEFDDAFTAPLHGFSGVDEYYRVCSARQYLSRIDTPTTVLHALDDPFMTPDVVPGPDELSASVTVELASHGGHVGFVTGRVPGRARYWLEPRIVALLDGMLAAGDARAALARG